jgi:hypothetical protein
MLASLPCKICWEKHHTAFVKVVEGSEIYNFPIHTLVHFYFKIGSKSRTNKGTVKQFGARARRRAPIRAAPPSASGPTQTHPEVPHLPEVPRPESGSTPRRLEVARATRHVPALWVLARAARRACRRPRSGTRAALASRLSLRALHA